MKRWEARSSIGRRFLRPLVRTFMSPEKRGPKTTPDVVMPVIPDP